MRSLDLGNFGLARPVRRLVLGEIRLVLGEKQADWSKFARIVFYGVGAESVSFWVIGVSFWAKSVSDWVRSLVLGAQNETPRTRLRAYGLVWVWGWP